MAEYFEPTTGGRGDGFGKTTIGDTGKKRLRAHRGSDVWGTKITAATTGRVRFKGWSDEIGNILIQSTADGYWILYSHMKSPSSRKVGEMVIGGESAIGLVGNTGTNTSGAHCHIGFAVDPRPDLCSPKKLRDFFAHLDANVNKIAAAPKPVIIKKPKAKK